MTVPLREGASQVRVKCESSALSGGGPGGGVAGGVGGGGMEQGKKPLYIRTREIPLKM
jgi:hypothetical protein